MDTTQISRDRLQRWAIGSAYGAVFFAPFSITAAQTAQVVMLGVALFFFYRHRGPLLRSPLVWIMTFYVTYVVLRGAWAAHMEMPAIADAHWAGVKDWVTAAVVPMVLFGLVLAATGNWVKHGAGLLAAGLLGMAVHFVLNVSPESFLTALQGGRRYFFEIGFRGTSLTFPTLILGLAVFIPYVLSEAARERRAVLYATAFLLVLALAVSMAALIATLGRAAWINTGITLGLVSLLALWRYRRTMAERKVATIIAGCLLVATSAVITTLSWDAVSDRWQGRGTDTMARVLTTEIEALDSDSVSVRVALWKFGWGQFMKRPIVGYGPADPTYVGEYYGGWGEMDPDTPWQVKEQVRNLHNSHTGMLFRFGLLAYIPIALVMLITVQEAGRNLVLPGLPGALAIFVLGFIILLALWAMFADFFEKFRITQLYGPIIGIMCASHFSRKLNAHRAR